MTGTTDVALMTDDEFDQALRLADKKNLRMMLTQIDTFDGVTTHDLVARRLRVVEKFEAHTL